LSGKASSSETTAPVILDAVRLGATIDAAARSAGVPIGTVRSWASRGRKDPEGRYGAFSLELDAIRSERTTFRLSDEEEVALADTPMGHEEIERRLSAAIRRDNLAAMRLWLDIHPRVDPDPGSAEDAALLEFIPRERSGK
jgi:hypothetical protein